MTGPTESPLLLRLRQAGVPLDLRQEGWRLTFATFSVVDWGEGEFLTKLCEEAKERFIERMPRLDYGSSLQGIAYLPYLTSAPSSLRKPLTVAHRRSGTEVSIKADLNLSVWRTSSARARRVAFHRALTEGIEGIRGDRLRLSDRTALVSLFLTP